MVKKKLYELSGPELARKHFCTDVVFGDKEQYKEEYPFVEFGMCIDKFNYKKDEYELIIKQDDHYLKVILEFNEIKRIIDFLSSQVSFIEESKKKDPTLWIP